jgi:peptidoglycan hydrolase FlgJ
MNNLISSNFQTDFLSQGVADKTTKLKKSASDDSEKSKEKLKKLAADFESVFAQQLLKVMRDTVPESKFFDSHAMDMFNEMMDEEMAKEISTSKGGIGLADSIFRELSHKDDLINGRVKETDTVTNFSQAAKFYDLYGEQK